jgi:hypothetical protein
MAHRKPATETIAGFFVWIFCDIHAAFWLANLRRFQLVRCNIIWQHRVDDSDFVRSLWASQNLISSSEVLAVLVRYGRAREAVLFYSQPISISQIAFN